MREAWFTIGGWVVAFGVVLWHWRRPVGRFPLGDDIDERISVPAARDSYFSVAAAEPWQGVDVSDVTVERALHLVEAERGE